MNRSMSDLSSYVRQKMKKSGWSLRQTAKEAEISVGALSNLLNNKAEPNPETLRRLANALRVDETYLMRLAGHLETYPLKPRDPSVEYLAQRLDQLSANDRELAIDVLRTQLDAITTLIEQREHEKK